MCKKEVIADYTFGKMLNLFDELEGVADESK